MGDKHIPLRTCIVTREKRPKNELARFVYDKSNSSVQLDPTGKFKGRGANLTLDLEIFDTAVEKGHFDRAFRTKLDKEALKELRDQFATLIKKREFRKGEKKVTVRIKGDPVKID